MAANARHLLDLNPPTTVEEVRGCSAVDGASSVGTIRGYVYALLAATILWAVVWHADAVSRMASLWWHSETFAHGLVIYPISIWLIYRSRDRIARLPLRPCLWALVPIAAAGFIALLGRLSGVDAAAEFGIVATIPLLFWCIAGTPVARALAFPLAFTLLAVPFGDFLLPVLMEQTADFTVAALRLTGVPVYREGLYFTVPSGNWSVVEACSGLRYLIASITLGCLFAYLSYRTLWRRALFILASVLVPIVANWLRAYMIVMLGHLSGMRLAVGVDHLIYGWVFFGVVMLLLFWVGSFWREDTVQMDTGLHVENGPRETRLGWATVLAAVSAAITVALGPLYAANLNDRGNWGARETLPVVIPEEWIPTEDASLASFIPHYLNPRATFHRTYTRGEPVGLYVAYYFGQSEGRELISHGNDVVYDKSWQRTGEQARAALRDDIQVVETKARSGLVQLTAWQIYWVGGRWTRHKESVKFWQAVDKLFGRGDAAAVVVVYSRSEREATKLLESFLSVAMPNVNDALARQAAKNSD